MRRLTFVAVVLTSVVAGLVSAGPADATTTSAKTLLGKLTVRAEAGGSSYVRRAFLYPFDADADTCDTREEVLLKESRVAVRRGAACRILSGRWLSSYDHRTWTRPRDVSVDHMVPFKEAWESGARRWTSLDRRRFANDLWFGWSMNVVTDDLKVAKGSRDPARWLPPKSRCLYAARWVAVKHRWRLTIDRAEKASLAKILKGACGARRLTIPTPVTLGATAASPLPTPVTSPMPNTASGDINAPSAPSALRTDVHGSSVTLSWVGSEDDVGVARYDLHRSGLSGFVPGPTTFIGSTGSHTYTDPSRPAGAGHYRVVAADAGGNLSAPSDEASATVSSPGPAALLAVGDIVCPPGAAVTAATCRHRDVADVVAAVPNAYFVPLGDLQYLNASYEEFVGAGGYDSTFGALRPRTLPVIGNHEQVDPAGPARGYFDYFYGPSVTAGPYGTRPGGYYTQTVGGWQFIALNSECRADTANASRAVPGGCAVGSPQYRWLESVLASSTARCTVAAFHRPRWTTGNHASYTPMGAMWDLMVRSGVDVVISAHNHSTEVFQLITEAGAENAPILGAGGIRSFVAGGGGRSHSTFPDSSSLVWEALQARDSTTYGPLHLTLNDGSFDWAFVPIAGQTFTNVRTTGAFSGSAESCR